VINNIADCENTRNTARRNIAINTTLHGFVYENIVKSQSE